jgi:hypothetical protein
MKRAMNIVGLSAVPLTPFVDAAIDERAFA